MTLCANATNWIEIVSDTQEENFYYIDNDSVNITSEDSQMFTAFFKSNELNSKGKKTTSGRQQMRINCRNGSFSIISAFNYDSNGKVISSYDEGLSFNPPRVAHPDTVIGGMVKASCYMAGFSQQ